MDFLQKLALNEHVKKDSPRDAIDKTGFDLLPQRLGFKKKKNRFGDYYIRLSQPQLHTPAADGWWRPLSPFGQGLKDSDEWLFAYDGFLYLDIETTSLSIGAGNSAFLVGIGYTRGRKFQVLQFLLHEYADEPAMLYAISRFSIGFQTLVTFNGHAFDIPMLQSRYDMNGLSASWLSLPNLDLYHLGRRVYSQQLQRFSLQSFEKEILGIQRDQDIPGKDIPAAYFAYQSRQEYADMQLVVAHHEQDIFSLGHLIIMLARRAANDQDSVVLFNLLYVLTQQKQWDKALKIAEQIMALVQRQSRKISSLVPSGKTQLTAKWSKRNSKEKYLSALMHVFFQYKMWDKVLVIAPFLADDKKSVKRLVYYYQFVAKDNAQCVQWLSKYLSLSGLTEREIKIAQKRLDRLSN